MAFLTHFILPGQPQYVIIRGNNRDAIFLTNQDYLFYLDILKRACNKYFYGKVGIKLLLLIVIFTLYWCYRYLELNPVRANMVEHAADYPWSSYRYNAIGEHNLAITPHTQYIALG